MTLRILRGAALGLSMTAVVLAVKPSVQAGSSAPVGASSDARTLEAEPGRGTMGFGAASAGSAAEQTAPVVNGQKIALLRPDASPYAVAATLGLTVEAADRIRGSALFSGEERQLEALDAHREILETWSNGRTFAASDRMRRAVQADVARPWHHAAANVQGPSDGLADIIIAVLDSGVAYRTGCGSARCGADEPPIHRRVASLAGVPIVAPMDFVDGDAEPLDEHQHGTHVAATIVGRGAHPGVAAGASLMPVRVLDAAGQGGEYALVRGIHHAIEHGADLINLSLTFRPGFVPSPVFLDALEAAATAGVPVLASTGNEGLGIVSWPAASPSVVAVAASAPEVDHPRIDDPWRSTGIAHLAPYSNSSAAVDLVAPGGDLTMDRTGDGHPDGILAETIALGDPSETGLWWFEGTSHAAAIATGAAARLLALGAAPDEVIWALQRPARPLRGEGPQAGVGGGYLDVAGSEDAVSAHSAYLASRPDVQVELEPYLERGEDERVRPALDLRVVGADHSPGASVQLHATFSDGTEAWSVRCATRAETDACTVHGDWAVSDATAPRTWTVQVDGVHHPQGVITRPGRGSAADLGPEARASVGRFAQARSADDAMAEGTAPTIDDGASTDGHGVVVRAGNDGKSPLALISTHPPADAGSRTHSGDGAEPITGDAARASQLLSSLPGGPGTRPPVPLGAGR